MSAAPSLRLAGGNFVTPARRQASLLKPGNFFFLNQSGSLSQLGWDDLSLDKLSADHSLGCNQSSGSDRKKNKSGLDGEKITSSVSIAVGVAREFEGGGNNRNTTQSSTRGLVPAAGLVSKLWRYNQHYFDDLNAFDAVSRKDWHIQLMNQWVEENKPGSGTGWEPYPTSLRIVNWIKWGCAVANAQGDASTTVDNSACKSNQLSSACLHSLAVQARWLTQQIEWHLLGNHLFANAKALVFVGTFFEGEESRSWLDQGLKIIRRQLPEQVLEDGGNFERSPMYHAIFLEDLLDLINLNRRYPGLLPSHDVESWRVSAGKMLRWLELMCHPDGEISLFNDAAIGIAPSPTELFAYAKRLGVETYKIQSDPLMTSNSNRVNSPRVPFSASVDYARETDKARQFVENLAESGYVRLASVDAAMILDVAPVGPDYLPGHAHADTLSFELSLFGQRVFVNGGTSQYGTGEVRHLERSTATHNTVEINGENSSEVWGGFRVARRAYPFDLDINESDDHVIVTCAQDGYRRLKGKLVHRRKWDFSDQVLLVEDIVEGGFETAFAYFHIHPTVAVSQWEVVSSSAAPCSLTRASWCLSLETGHKVVVTVEKGAAQLVDSHYSPEFGKRLKTQCLKIALAKLGRNESDEGRASDKVGRYTGCSSVRITWGV